MQDFRPAAPNADGEISTLVQRVNLTLLAKPKRIVAFIAARAGEGTSTIARAFAEIQAEETGHKTLLIDAGTLDSERFMMDGINPSLGIVDLAGSATGKSIHCVEENVYVGRWLGQEKNRHKAGRLLHDADFWAGLQEEFETIVIDAPALQSSSDGIALAVQADAVVLVVEAESTRQPVIEQLRNTLVAAGAKIAGSVLNKRRFYIPAQVYARL